MNQYNYYAELIKPTWAPPAWLFGPVWLVLYLLIIFSFGFVFYQALKKKISWQLTIPFLLNLFFNLIFTPIQFGLQNNILASIDIILVVGTLIWALLSVWSRFRWVVYLNIPYLLWGSFATVLQLVITFLNN